MLMNSAKSDKPMGEERWIKLKVDFTIDNMEDNHVGGEIHVRYKFQPVKNVLKIHTKFSKEMRTKLSQRKRTKFSPVFLQKWKSTTKIFR